jgi:hypothetical protein
MTTFSVISYFDPYGDGKSSRKVFSRQFFHTEKTKEEILQAFENRINKYYGGVDLRFKPYKKTKQWN